MILLVMSSLLQVLQIQFQHLCITLYEEAPPLDWISSNHPYIPPLPDVCSDEYTDDYLISSGLLIKGNGCRNWICKTCRKEDVKSKIVRHIQGRNSIELLKNLFENLFEISVLIEKKFLVLKSQNDFQKHFQ